MKLFSKVILAVSILIGGGVIAIPNIYNSKINDFIYESQKEFELKGIETKIKTTNDNYFNVKREYIVSIKDSSFIVNKFLNNFEANLNKKDLNQIKNLVNNTEFLFTVNLPKYPSSYQKDAVKISLNDISPIIQKNINGTKIGQELLSFIDNKGFELAITLDNFKISEAKLKDIDVNFKDKDIKIKQNINKLVIDFEKINEFKLNVDSFQTVVQNRSIYYGLKINSVKYDISEKDILNAIEKVNVDNISISLNDRNMKSQLTFKNITTNTVMGTKENLFELISDMEIKNINFNFDDAYFKFDNFVTKVSLNDINKNSIKNVIDSLDDGEEKIIENLENLFNEGFLFNLNKLAISSGNISFKNDDLKLGNFSLNSKIKVDSNNINFNNRNNKQILNFVSSDLNIEILKKDILRIMNKFKVPNKFLEYVKIENENAFINAEFKANNLYVNNKKLL